MFAGFYQCSNCGISGQWSTLQNQINKKGEGELPKPKHVIKVDPADSKWRELSEKLQNLSSLPPDERSKIIEKFDLKVCISYKNPMKELSHTTEICDLGGHIR